MEDDPDTFDSRYGYHRPVRNTLDPTDSVVEIDVQGVPETVCIAVSLAVRNDAG